MGADIGRHERFSLGELRLAALGDRPGIGYDIKFGANVVIDTGTVPEDVWNGGGIYTGHPVDPTAETIDVVSNSAEDGAGTLTGALTVKLAGLDANWAHQEETITMNGLTNVTTTKLWARMPRMQVMTAGSTGHNVGEISAFHTTTTANIFAVMPAEFNKTHICAFTVPANQQGLVIASNISVTRANNASTSAFGSLLVRPFGGVFNSAMPYDVTPGGSDADAFAGGILLPEKSDVKYQVTAVGSSSTRVVAHIEYITVWK